MSLTTVSGIIAALVLIAAFVLALMGSLSWTIAAMVIGLSVALLISGRVSVP